MRLHRFYLPNTADAKDQNLGSKSLWVHESGLLAQWKKVLRYKEGQELVLFDDNRECLYRIIDISKNDSVHLEYVTEFNRALNLGISSAQKVAGQRKRKNFSKKLL